ncbi:hypothetical protein V6N12_010403 [Hibiscus sabdariffa]|uniref:Uncharacterized protein n=1 Tax=Hibiscus sabdariffa TaxID=183260 RepID=A0ABR2EJZ5_9ROSI
MTSIDSSIAFLHTSFDSRITSLQTRIGGVENSLTDFHHEWRTLSHGDGDDGDHFGEGVSVWLDAYRYAFLYFASDQPKWSHGIGTVFLVPIRAVLKK